MANAENILKVADAIEKHSIPDLGFNMGDWLSPTSDEFTDQSGRECGTIACIAGWTCAVLAGDAEKVWEFTYDQLGALLGIDRDDASSLFVPTHLNLKNVQPDQAIRTLRHLAATNEIDWTV